MAEMAMIDKTIRDEVTEILSRYIGTEGPNGTVYVEKGLADALVRYVKRRIRE